MEEEGMLTEGQLRALVRELLEEISGAGVLLAEKRRQSRGDKSDGRPGWQGG